MYWLAWDDAFEYVCVLYTCTLFKQATSHKITLSSHHPVCFTVGSLLWFHATIQLVYNPIGLSIWCITPYINIWFIPTIQLPCIYVCKHACSMVFLWVVYLLFSEFDYLNFLNIFEACHLYLQYNNSINICVRICSISCLLKPLCLYLANC
jgi:hypothetical protein